jgi:hypothetical protein
VIVSGSSRQSADARAKIEISTWFDTTIRLEGILESGNPVKGAEIRSLARELCAVVVKAEFDA